MTPAEDTKSWLRAVRQATGVPVYVMSGRPGVTKHEIFRLEKAEGESRFAGESAACGGGAGMRAGVRAGSAEGDAGGAGRGREGSAGGGGLGGIAEGDAARVPEGSAGGGDEGGVRQGSEIRDQRSGVRGQIGTELGNGDQGGRCAEGIGRLVFRGRGRGGARRQGRRGSGSLSCG